MNVNLGCGTYPAPGWVNVDRRPFDGVDYALDITSLPWADHSVEKVYAGHVLEHLTYDDELPRALTEIHRVLVTDGVLLVVGPDLDRAREDYPTEVENIWPGAIPLEGSEPGAAHQWASTVGATEVALRAAGFGPTEIPIASIPSTWPLVSRIGWQFAILAEPIDRT